METNTRTVHTDGSQDSSHQLRHMVDEIDTYLRSAADSGDQKFNAVRDKLAVQVREIRARLTSLNQATLARASSVPPSRPTSRCRRTRTAPWASRRPPAC